MNKHDKKLLAYLTIALFILSPYIVANLFISEEKANQNGGAVGVGIAVLAFFGPVVITATGFLLTLVLKFLGKSSILRYILSFFLPALIINILILI